MPRNYLRKTDRAPYTKEKLEEAIQLVKNGTLSAYAASKLYGIPRPTIVNRIYKRRGFKSNSLGRDTILKRDVEESLVTNLHIMEKYGFGLTRKELLEAVGKYINANSIASPFKNGVPGEDWFLGFKKRHGLSVKKPQPVEIARKNACRPDIIYPYFDLLEKTLDELALRDKPAQVWNLDETSFSKDPSKSKVVGLKGFASTRTISSPGKDNTTVLLGCNAVGEKTPPLIIYKGKNVWDEWTSQDAYPGTVYAATTNGWMESPVFETFFEKVFLSTVGERRPILLIYDGHSTHVGINIIEKARKAGITILKIPPHTSDVLQPLDLAVNKSFKDKWDATLVKWQRQNVGKALPKKDFSKMIGQIWTNIDPSVCSAGFKKAGIYPFNKNVVPEEKFNQILLKEWKSRTFRKNEEVSDGALYPDSVSEFGVSRYMDSGIKHIFQEQQNEYTHMCTYNQPQQLQKLVLARINRVISGPRTGIFLQSSYDQTEYDSSKQSIKVPTNLQQSISIGSKYNLNEPPTSTQEELFKKFSFPIPIDHDVSQKNYITHSSSSHRIENSQNSYKAKFQILEDRSVKYNISFEDLLLQSINSGSSSKIKRRKIASGAEVITHDDVYNRCKSIEAEKEEKAKQKEQKVKKKQQKVKEKEQKAKQKQQKPKESKRKTKGKKKVQTSLEDKENTTGHTDNTKEINIVKTYDDSKNKNLNKARKRKKRSGSSSTTLSNYSFHVDDSSEYNPEDDLDIMSNTSKENKQTDKNDMHMILDDLISDYFEQNDTPQLKEINRNTDFTETSNLIISHENQLKKIELHINTIGYFSDDDDTCDDKKDMHYVERKKTDSVRTINEKTVQEEDKTDCKEIKIRNRCIIEEQNSVKEQIPPSCATPIEVKKTIPLKTYKGRVKQRQTMLQEKNKEEIVKVKLEKTNKQCNNWIVGDTILTRYYSRGSWKYHVGEITETYCSKNTYEISYFKIKKQKQGIIFFVPKRKDIDIIPEDMIVKSIQLLHINEKPEFVLMEDEDIVYFS